MGERKGVYSVLVEILEGRKPFRRPSHRWEENIKMHEVGFGVWTGSSWLLIGTGGGHL